MSSLKSLLTQGLLVTLASVSMTLAQDLDLTLRSHQKVKRGDVPTIREEAASWKAEETAIIVCDMWDYHHSVNAVRRLKEFAPRLDAVLTEARKHGVTIIHSPSDCMPFYEKDAARKRALALSKPDDTPANMAAWCHRIPEEEQAIYPIDQSNGGEDDDLEEHAQWAAYLESIGRNSGTPWMRQTELLVIDQEKDYICAEGDVAWAVLQKHKIKNVLLTGVHLNMCVLGRPFGLRQMKRAGKNVALMRDMTDVMYEPNSWPYVSHFSALDLVVEHVEQFVCPSITSDQIIGGEAFRFRGDRRPRIAVAAGENYLPNLRAFVNERLRESYRVTLIGPDTPLSSWMDVDLLWLPTQAGPEVLDVEAVQRFASQGKALIGPLNKAPKINALFGAEDLRYAYGAADNPIRVKIDSEDKHPLLTGVDQLTLMGSPANVAFGGDLVPFVSFGKHAMGWTYVRPDSGLSVALPLDSDLDADFQQLVINAVALGTGQGIVGKPVSAQKAFRDHWVSLASKGNMFQLSEPQTKELTLRCLVDVPASWKENDVELSLVDPAPPCRLYWNGGRLDPGDNISKVLKTEELNVLVIQLLDTASLRGPVPPELQALGYVAKSKLPKITLTDASGKPHTLPGNWQIRQGHDLALNAFPIPPQFGAATDYIIEISE